MMMHDVYSKTIENNRIALNIVICVKESRSMWTLGYRVVQKVSPCRIITQSCYIVLKLA